MKVQKIATILLSSFALTSCMAAGGGSGTPGSFVNVDEAADAPVVTIGAGCAAASRHHFDISDRGVGLSGVAPGRYEYVESESLYVSEDPARGTVIEGHVTDHQGGDSAFSSALDCHTDQGLQPSLEYAGHLNVRFPVKIQITRDGDLRTSEIRHLDVNQYNGTFTVNAQDSFMYKAVNHGDLKRADSLRSPNPNQRIEIWQNDRGGLFMLFHEGLLNGTLKTTKDTIVRYHRVDDDLDRDRDRDHDRDHGHDSDDHRHVRELTLNR